MKFSSLLGSSLFTLLLGVGASATPQAPDLAHLYPGYEPTVFKNTAPIFEIFKDMPTDFKEEKSQCFQRAEIWSYDLYRNRDVKAMKAFVFYTHSYRDYKEGSGDDFDWWFHVAPYVLYQGRDGSTKEAVLDPTFADAPMNMQAWSQLFVDSGKKCKEFVRYSDFSEEVEDDTNKLGEEHCYIVRVPATDFDPNAIEARDSGEVTGYQFDIEQVKLAAKKAPNRSLRKEIKRRLGL